MLSSRGGTHTQPAEPHSAFLGDAESDLANPTQYCLGQSPYLSCPPAHTLFPKLKELCNLISSPRGIVCAVDAVGIESLRCASELAYDGLWP